MKIKYVQQLLESMSPRNKEYWFVEMMHTQGLNRIPIGYHQLLKLQKLMDKKGINWKPSLWEQLVGRVKLWWYLESPWAKRDMKKYEGLSRTTFTENLPTPSK